MIGVFIGDIGSVSLGSLLGMPLAPKVIWRSAEYPYER